MFETKGPVLAILNEPYDVEENNGPFGERWGGQIISLSPEHLKALQEGKTVAVDALEEYVVFLQLKKPGG
jgi:hypothetical protein